MAMASRSASFGRPCDLSASTRAHAVGTCSGGGEEEEFSMSHSSLLFPPPRARPLTVPQGPPSGVEQGAVEVAVVTVVGVVVLGDDVLQVGVLPVEVAGLDGPREHGPVRPRERICEAGEEEVVGEGRRRRRGKRR